MPRVNTISFLLYILVAYLYVSSLDSITHHHHYDSTPYQNSTQKNLTNAILFPTDSIGILFRYTCREQPTFTCLCQHSNTTRHSPGATNTQEPQTHKNQVCPQPKEDPIRITASSASIKHEPSSLRTSGYEPCNDQQAFEGHCTTTCLC